MKLISKKIVVSKTAPRVLQIVQACACRFAACDISETAFRIHCSTRRHSSRLSLTEVTGAIVPCGDAVEITLHVHAGLGFWVGCVLLLLGITNLITLAFSITQNWISVVGPAGVGAVIATMDVWEGAEHLNKIQRKLLE